MQRINIKGYSPGLQWNSFRIFWLLALMVMVGIVGMMVSSSCWTTPGPWARTW